MRIDFKKLLHSLKDAIIGFLALAFFITIVVVIMLPLLTLVDWIAMFVMSKIGDIGICIILFIILIGFMTRDIYKSS